MTAHFLDGMEPGHDGLLALVDRALALRAGAPARRFEGKSLAAVFFDPSLRTRTSLEVACAQLGVHPVVLHPSTDAWGWAYGEGEVMDGAAAEHVNEAIPVLASYADALAIRCFASDAVLDAAARLSSVPVLNLESPRGHPLQGLADAATWRSRLGPSLVGRRLCLTWAPHPRPLPRAVPHQVVRTATQLGMDVVVAHPEGLDLDPDVMARSAAVAAARGGRLSVTHDQAEALAGAEVVYAKAWSGPMAAPSWQVDALPASTGFMHCLPVRRNVVVSDAVLDGAGSWVQEQAALRRWTALAVLEHLLGGGSWASS